MWSIEATKPSLGSIFGRIASRDVKVANQMAVTFVSEKVQTALTGELIRSIDRPTQFTMKSIFRKRVKDGDFFAYQVYIRDDSSRGVPPARYLAPLIYGGVRSQKHYEKVLGSMAAVNARYAMPGLGARLDASGNMSGQIRELLSYFGAAELKAGYQANTSAKTKKRLAKGNKKKGIRGFSYFMSAGRGVKLNRARQNLPVGIWQRYPLGNGKSEIKPVLIFTSQQPRYKAVIRFYETVDATLQREWSPASQRALRIALSSSKSLSNR